MQPILDKKGKLYIVAYGYEDKFELTEQEAQKLIEAVEKGLKLIKFSNRVFSTNFSWIMPKEETRTINLNSRELELCEKIAEWLSRPINEMEWSYEQALSYSKKIMARIGLGEVEKLWKLDANGAYPSVKQFLIDAKQIETGP